MEGITTTRADRLKLAVLYLKNKGIIKSQQDVADRMKANRTSVSLALKGNESYLTDNFIAKFNAAFDSRFSLKWLMEGEGAMEGGFNDVSSSYVVPSVPLSSAGGTLRDISCDGVTIQDCEKVISPVNNAQFAIGVYGDSMAPTYPNGCRVFIRKIDMEAFISWGSVFVLDTVNGIYVKEVQRGKDDRHILCVSHNSSGRFPPFEVSLDDIYGMYRVLASVVVTQ